MIYVFIYIYIYTYYNIYGQLSFFVSSGSWAEAPGRFKPVGLSCTKLFGSKLGNTRYDTMLLEQNNSIWGYQMLSISPSQILMDIDGYWGIYNIHQYPNTTVSVMRVKSIVSVKCKASGRPGRCHVCPGLVARIPGENVTIAVWLWVTSDMQPASVGCEGRTFSASLKAWMKRL